MKTMTIRKMRTATASPAYIAALPASAATLTATVKYKEHMAILCQHLHICQRQYFGEFKNTEYITYIHNATEN